jgi:glycosyltransferase involved in cell wall biosynthesis
MVKPIRPPSVTRAPRPLLSLCVMFRDNVESIKPLLASVKDHFDEYVFLDTGSVDGTRRIVEGFFAEDCVGKQTKIVDFPWVDDFAKARQANFEAATGIWRMFLDSDDVLVHGENLREIVTKGPAAHPNLQGFFVHYDYDVLEELPTMRLVRWTRAWRWCDAIHERLVSDVPLAPDALAQLPAADLSVTHRRKTIEQRDNALRRNSAIARREYDSTTDEEYRGRLARTIAMELKLQGDYDTASFFLQEVGEKFPTMPEGRQAFADLFRFAAQKKDFETALQYAKRAGPSYETLAYAAMGNHAKVLSRGAVAMNAGPQTTHEGFLFEQVLTPVAIAESALALGKPASAAERVLNHVRTDLREHESCINHVMNIRGDIDRITICVPSTPQPFDGSSTGDMLGGSEEAVVYLSRALAKLGRNVRVYGVLPPTTLPGLDANGVDWQPFSTFRMDAEHGTLVIWRSIGMIHEIMQRKSQIQRRIAAGDTKARLPTGIGRASLWLHDRDTGVSDAVLQEKLMLGVDSVVVLSEFHKWCIARTLPEGTKVNLTTLSNGIVIDDMAQPDNPGRDPNRVIYSSCPSRGLVPLLQMWPEVKAACPDAYLDIYYDWSMLRDGNPEVYKRVIDAYDAVRHLDVKHHGGVGHAELHEALGNANVWAYSHFENPEVETFCISAVKATACGATVLTTRNGAVPEVAPKAHFADTVEDYRQKLISLLKAPESPEVRAEKAAKARERFDWNEVAKRFSEIWTLKA